MTKPRHPPTRDAIRNAVQTLAGRLGYKIVRLAPYEARNRAAGQRAQGINKIFGIGYNKTASSSLEAVLRACGYRMPRQIDQERLLDGLPQSGDYGLLRDFVADFDAFQDMPFSRFETWVACDVLFPGSKFILTVRDEDAWLRSYDRYYRALCGVEPDEMATEAHFTGAPYLHDGYVHGMIRRSVMRVAGGIAEPDWSLAFDADHLRTTYSARNAQIMRYFADRPDDLLVIDLSREPDTRRIAAFLDLPADAVMPIPHRNAAPTGASHDA